jgi:hypothetical protein
MWCGDLKMMMKKNLVSKFLGIESGGPSLEEKKYRSLF